MTASTDPPENAALPVSCVGWLGRIFGHKFKKSLGDWVYSTNYCTRCGMPAGGWGQ